MVIVAGSASGVWAADIGPYLKAAPAETGWYYYGGLEAGARFYIDRPGSGFGRNADGSFLLPTQTQSRAKFEEYGKLPSGLFLDWIHLGAGSNDGRYNVDFWGDNVGLNSQSYNFGFAQNGVQYLNLGWDQTPHLWSYSAKSLFGGIGSTNLTVATPIQDYLRTHLLGTDRYNYINANATQIDELSMQRDRFSADYRYTPTPNWDFNVSYSHEDRTGTRPGTLSYHKTAAQRPTNVIGIPYPVDDTTHTPKASGEYAGAGPWGKYSFKLGYAGSIYTDNLTLLTVQNPFGQTGGQVYGTLRVPLPPSNQAHAFTGSGAFDIPVFKSRFTTTNQLKRMTQNEAFLDTSNNGLTADPLPISSLNGDVRTFLTNNILTSSLTANLRNKLGVRYYEHTNRTEDEVSFTNQLYGDATLTPRGPTEYLSYKKTNIDEDLTWTTPVEGLTVGAGYGFERWNRHNRFTSKTDEHVGRMFANWQANDWAQWRTSYSYGVRRYRGEYELPAADPWLNSRMFDLADRNQHKARTLLDITVTDAITVTPNAGLRWDDYPGDAPNQLGVSSNHAWNAGVDVGFVVSPTLRLMAGYNFERSKLGQSAAVPNASGIICNPADAIIPPQCIWSDNLTQTYHSLVASANWKAIPNKLDIRLNYAASWAREAHNFTPCSLNDNDCNGVGYGLPWPDNNNLYQRFEAIARYNFDKDTVQRLGWKGKVMAKLRYRWEKNGGSFWQSDAVNAYNPNLNSAADSTFLAYDNPYYTVHLISASLVVKW